MAKYNPIGLYDEGTAIQTHDGYKDGDTIAARHQDIVGYISAKAGNAIRLGSDKLLYVNNLCRGTSAKTPTAASDPFAAGYPKPSSPLFPKAPEAGAALQLADSYVPYPFYNVTKQRLPAASRHAPVLLYNNAFGGAHGRPHGQVLDRVIDVRDLISHDRGNALRIGEDGLLYIHNCCRAAP